MRARVRARVGVHFCLVRFAHLDEVLTVATHEACTLETVLFSGSVPVIAAADSESQPEFVLG